MMRDVCVVGGGPAGLAAGIALRQRGFSVAVLDARRPPIDKTCGEGLLPGAFGPLRALGIEPSRLRGVALRGIRFLSEEVSVCADFPGGEGRGVRRTVLHAALVARAVECGVDIRWNTPVSGLDALRPGWVIGADGIQSRVREWAGLGAATRNSRRFGFQRHYRIAPWSDSVEVYWGKSGQAYVTPVAEDEIGVAILTRHRGKRVDDVVSEFPDLHRRLAGAGVAGDRGAVTLARRLQRVTRGNVALTGDASGSVDAITGEGLALSFRQALLLGESLAAGDLTGYEKGHGALAARTRFMGDLMLLLDRSTLLRRRAISVMARRPSLFAGLVALHTGEPKLPELVAGCAKLGWWLAVSPVRLPTL